MIVSSAFHLRLHLHLKLESFCWRKSAKKPVGFWNRISQTKFDRLLARARDVARRVSPRREGSCEQPGRARVAFWPSGMRAHDRLLRALYAPPTLAPPSGCGLRACVRDLMSASYALLMVTRSSRLLGIASPPLPVHSARPHATGAQSPRSSSREFGPLPRIAAGGSSLHREQLNSAAAPEQRGVERLCALVAVAYAGRWPPRTWASSSLVARPRQSSASRRE